MGAHLASEPKDLAEIVRRHRRHLFAVALSRTGRVETADDVVQTVLLRVSARGLEGVEDPRAYLTRAVVNQSRNVVTRTRDLEALREARASEESEPTRRVARKELAELLRTAIRGLPEALRTVVWLVHVEGLSPAEVARATGARPLTVKSALARGRKRLRERLGPVLRRAGYLEV
jgi:RNA polymerase sigma-70 factor (ECF subfamily)